MTPGVTGLKMTKPAAYNRTGSVGWASDAENNSTAQDPGGEDKELRMQGFAQFQIPSSNSKTHASGKQTQPKQRCQQKWCDGRFVTHEVFSDPPQRHFGLYQ